MDWHLSRIPKKAYFYWGTELFPWIRYVSLETFVKHHPDWEVFLYVKPSLDRVPEDTDKSDNCWSKVEALGVKIVELDIEKHLGVDFPAKYITIYADIFRYIVLGQTGGFYADTDMLFFRALEQSPFNNPGYEGKDVFMLPPPYHHFLWGVKDASWWKKVLDYQVNHLPHEGSRFLDTTACTCYIPQSYNDRIQILPMTTCEENFNANGPVDVNAIALNWHGSGTYGKYRAVNEQNYMESDHPLAACVRFCLTGAMGPASGIGSFQWINRGE